MKKILVDGHACQGHTLCAMVAPEVFGLRDEDGHSYALNGGKVPAELEASATAAIDSCPERAIRWVEEGKR